MCSVLITNGLVVHRELFTKKMAADTFKSCTTE
jgi:hypothetical protein